LETEEPLGTGTVMVETVSFEVEVLFETVPLVVMVVFEMVMVVFEVVMVVFEMVTFVALQGNMNTGIVKVILEYL